MENLRCAECVKQLANNYVCGRFLKLQEQSA